MAATLGVSGLLYAADLQAREADQFTHRPTELAQLSESATYFNQWVNHELDRGAARLNQAAHKRITNGQPPLTPDEATTLIAESFLDPLLPELHTPVEFWATSPAGRRVLSLEHPGRRGIYSDTTLKQVHWSWFTGVSNTLKLGGVLLGVDKLGHFFAQGYQYHLEANHLSARGTETEAIRTRVRELGHEMELGKMGLVTMAMYSPADLAANWDGWTFWTQVFGTEAPFLSVDSMGQWHHARHFQIQDFVRPDWDEALNPPYAETPQLAATLQRTIQQRCLREARAGTVRDPLPEPQIDLTYRVPESRLPAGATRIRFECL
jgi:hypothetical protein